MGLLYKKSRVNKNKEKIMDDKQIINVLLNKIQRLNQENLQQEINAAMKDADLAAANEKIAALEKTEDFTITKEENS
jgi:hypothetical protein